MSSWLSLTYGRLAIMNAVRHILYLDFLWQLIPLTNRCSLRLKVRVIYNICVPRVTDFRHSSRSHRLVSLILALAYCYRMLTSCQGDRRDAYVPILKHSLTRRGWRIRVCSI